MRSQPLPGIRTALCGLALATPGACTDDPVLGKVGGSPNPRVEAGPADAAGCDAGVAGIAEPVLPCEIEAILAAKCQRCHADPPRNEAPFPLLTWADTRADAGQPVFERMKLAVETGFMPFRDAPLDPPVEDLTEMEKAILLEWLGSCALPSDGARCDASAPFAADSAPERGLEGAPDIDSGSGGTHRD